jgi:hypothetical protein
VTKKGLQREYLNMEGREFMKKGRDSRTKKIRKVGGDI